MKKFFLETRWIGLLAVMAFALLGAALVAKTATDFMRETAPGIADGIRDFLPVAIENGAIVDPADTVVRKTFSEEDASFDVVLDTRVDTLDVIPGNGLYFTRKAVYVVSPQKTEVRPLDVLPDMVFDGEKLDALLAWLENHFGAYLFVAVFVALFAFVSVAVLVYSAIAHLLVGMHFPVRFSRTLRITVWTYLVSTSLAWFAGLPIGIIVKFVLVLLANFLLDKFCRPQPPPPPIPQPAP